MTRTADDLASRLRSGASPLARQLVERAALSWRLVEAGQLSTLERKVLLDHAELTESEGGDHD